MPSQLTKLALVESDNTLHTFSVVQDGVAEATRQAFSIEADDVTIENERRLIASKLYNITVAGLLTNQTVGDIYTLSSNDTELEFAGFGLKHILQGTGTINANDGYEGNLSIYFTSPRRAVGGYLSTGLHSAGVVYCENGLALYKWQEGSTSNVPAGYTATGSTTWDEVNEELDIASSATVERTLAFPFSTPLTFSVVASSTSGNPQMSVVELDDEGSTVTTNSITLVDGTNVLAFTPDATTVDLKLQFVADADDSVTIKNPAMNLGTRSASEVVFTEFNT